MKMSSEPEIALGYDITLHISSLRGMGSDSYSTANRSVSCVVYTEKLGLKQTHWIRKNMDYVIIDHEGPPEQASKCQLNYFTRAEVKWGKKSV